MNEKAVVCDSAWHQGFHGLVGGFRITQPRLQPRHLPQNFLAAGAAQTFQLFLKSPNFVAKKRRQEFLAIGTHL